MLYHHFIDTIFVVVVKETKKFPFFALSLSLSFEIERTKMQNTAAAAAAVYVFCAAKRYISTINKLLTKQTNAIYIYIACLVIILEGFGYSLK